MARGETRPAGLSPARGRSCGVSDDPELGTIWGPRSPEVGGKRVTGGGDRRCVGVEIPLGRRQRAMAGDFPKDVQRNARIGHPGEARVPEVVTAKVLVPEPGDDFVSVGGVA